MSASAELADPQPKTDKGAAKTDISDAVFQVDSATDALGGGVLPVIWRMISKHQGRMWVAIVFGIASAFCQVIPPVAAAKVIESLLAGESLAAVYWAIAMVVGAAGLVALFAISTTISHLIAADVQRDQRQLIGEKLKAVPLGLFSTFSSVDLRKILVDDIETLEDGVAHLIPEISAAVFGPLFMLLLMLLFDWRLALAAAAPTVAGFIIMSFIMRSGVEPMNRFLKAQAKIAATMTEVVKAIPVVKTYNNGDAALVRADAAVNSFRDIIDEWIAYAIIPSNWFFLLATSNLVLLTPLSIYLYSQGQVDLPTVVFFHLAAMSLALLVSNMFGVTNRIRIQEGVIARWTALNAQPELEFAEAGPVPQGANVSFEHVTFRYDETNVIEDFSLQVPAGSSVALVGPSGSGKTTLARLLARFWDVQNGHVLVGGVDVRDLPPERLAEHVSFVFQEIFLFTRSVADNIRVGKPDASGEELMAAAKAARAHDFIMALPDGYDTVISGTLGLSVGQKQRLSIARALLRNAPVLVLDEATAFSDPENEREVQQAISALAADKTLIIIAHRLSTIQNADQIVYLMDGKAVERGTHADLLQLNGAYADQWRAHTQAKSFRFTKRPEAMNAGAPGT